LVTLATIATWPHVPLSRTITEPTVGVSSTLKPSARALSSQLPASPKWPPCIRLENVNFFSRFRR
jgi:hypothetical protein